MYLNNSIAKRQKTAATPAPPVQVPNGSWAITPASPVQALGSTTKILNYDGSSGASERGYKPWGEVRFGPDDYPTAYQYTGQYRDKLIGLYYYGARWYDTALGRFVQPDTIIADSENPQSWDRYAYVINNPLKYIDPSGHYASEPLIDGLYSVEYAVNHANEIGECPPGQDPIKSLDDPEWKGWLATLIIDGEYLLLYTSLNQTNEIKALNSIFEGEKISGFSISEEYLFAFSDALYPVLDFVTSVLTEMGYEFNIIEVGVGLAALSMGLSFLVAALLYFTQPAKVMNMHTIEEGAAFATLGVLGGIGIFVGTILIYDGLEGLRPPSWPDDFIP